MDLRTIYKNLSNIPGKRVKNRIVVFESDDWGAIRMAKQGAYERLKQKGVWAFDEDEERYLSNDCVESATDMESLFEVLTSVKGGDGSHARFTALSLVSNPDFARIKEGGFKEYYGESVLDTYNRYWPQSNPVDAIKEGIEQSIFVPQFHGREHLNVQNWMSALRLNEPDTLAAFDEMVYGITPAKPVHPVSYQAAFDLQNISEITYQKTVIADGLRLFEKIWGYKASFFVATNGPFNNSLEPVLSDNGIKYIGASKIQSEPLGDGKTRRVFHYLGQKNRFGQIYLTRNAFFEPSSNLKTDWVDSCLSDIQTAFRWHKPAVISTHRVNYTGGLNIANRDRGLSQLSVLVKKIVTLWPDVIFMTSSQLGDLLQQK